MQAWNEGVFRAIWSVSGQSFLLDGLALIMAHYLGYAVILGGIIFFLSYPDWRAKIFRLCQVLLALVLVRGFLTSFIKYFYSSPRPADVLGIKPLALVSGNSFPAENMVTLFIFATLVFIASRKWGLIFYAVSLTVGLAQIVIGIHWPIDVLGGALLGLMGALLIYFISRRYERALYKNEKSP